MFRSVTIGILGLVVNALLATSAWAYTTEYFTITRLNVNSSCKNMLIIEGTFSSPPAVGNVTDQYMLSNSDSCDTYDEPAQLNFETNKKLLLAAFLAGKPVRLKYSGAQGSGTTYASVLAVFVCVDGVTDCTG